MIIISLCCIIIGFVFGIILCNLIWEDVETKHSLSKRGQLLYYMVSGLFMGCAFLCASHLLEADYCMDSMVILGGLVFLAVFAIQDMLQKAVYAFLLNIGSLGMIVLRCTVYIFDCEYINMFSFLFLSGAVYVGLKTVAKVFPRLMGNGDYDILFVIFLLCGSEGFVQVLFASSIAGLVICVPLLLAKHLKKEEKVPLAPFFYLGTLAYFVL